jgi:hypothetical protein
MLFVRLRAALDVDAVGLFLLGSAQRGPEAVRPVKHHCRDLRVSAVSSSSRRVGVAPSV